ncbi:hypothetical protein LCGC14_2680270, partial [marine sediment metagenome]
PLINNGTIGKIEFVKAEFGWDLRKWKSNLDRDYRKSYSAQKGGGVLFDVGPHELRYLLDFLGTPSSVWCMSGPNTLDIVEEDHVDIILKFKDSIAIVRLDYLNPNYTRKCYFFGEKGILIWDYGNGKGASVRLNTDSIPEWRIFRSPYDDSAMYLTELQYFLGCVEGKNKYDDDLNGVQMVRLLLACKRSLKQHRSEKFEESNGSIGAF